MENHRLIWGFSMIFPAMTGRNCPKYPIRAAVNRGHPEIVFRSQSPAGSPKYSILCAFDLEGLVGGRHQRYFYYRKTWNYRSVFITSIVFHSCSVIFQSVQPDFGLPKLELAVFQDFPSSHGLVETWEGWRGTWYPCMEFFICVLQRQGFLVSMAISAT